MRRTHPRWPVLAAALTAGLIATSGVIASESARDGSPERRGAAPVPAAEPAFSAADGRWQRTDVPVGRGDLTAVAALDSERVWAVGYRLIGNSVGQPVALRWDGRSWTEESRLPAGSWPQTLAVRSPDDIWAAGSGTAHWNGASWTSHAPAAEPGGGRVVPEALATGPDGAVWMAGRAVPGSVKNGVPSVQSWNGSGWERHALPDVGTGELTAITVIAPDDVWAVGTSFADGSGAQSALALHWDGRAWKRVEAPAAPVGEHRWFGGISAAGPDGTVWAVGGRVAPDGSERPFTARWNGRGWVAVPAPRIADGRLRAVSRDADGTVWAAGGKGAVSVVLRWDEGERRWERGADPGVVIRGFAAVPGADTLWTVGLSNRADLTPAATRLTG
ncbi:hypothetical protein [Streptomyces sp. NPDC001985]|uniref:hypothetical protein n=1 Tax=Streptomyces sp. NPDC001985 TaxID=3154406 RepID=UPI00332466AB